LLILTLQLQEFLYGFRVVGWIEDDELREDRRGGAAEDDRDGGGKDEAGSRPATHDRASYEGSVRSPERYTLSRCPSRMVTVGSTFRNRSRMCSDDWAALPATPSLYASSPVAARPTRASACARPPISPMASDTPNRRA